MFQAGVYYNITVQFLLKASCFCRPIHTSASTTRQRTIT